MRKNILTTLVAILAALIIFGAGVRCEHTIADDRAYEQGKTLTNLSFTLGVRYGIIAYQQDPTQDDLAEITQRAKLICVAELPEGR